MPNTTKSLLDEIVGQAPKISEREILWNFVLKMMDRFYDDREIWRRYGWALRLKRINPRKEMFNSVSNSFGRLTQEEIGNLTEEIHTLHRSLNDNGS